VFQNIKKLFFSATLHAGSVWLIVAIGISEGYRTVALKNRRISAPRSGMLE